MEFDTLTLSFECMSLSATIKSKQQAFKSNNPDGSGFDFLVSLVQGGLRVFMAKIYLRKCTSIGRMVSINKKPIIDNQGQMILGDEVRVWSNIVQAKLYTGRKGSLIVGTNSRLNGVHIDCQHRVEIGANVRIAPYTIILDSDFHDLKDHFSDGPAKAIIIEDDVWIATRSTILKGVRIGKGAVVATGAVVTRDVPPYTVVAGVPAKVVKKIDL